MPGVADFAEAAIGRRTTVHEVATPSIERVGGIDATPHEDVPAVVIEEDVVAQAPASRACGQDAVVRP